ncbi:MAG: DEAD/DEAH box helicase, partial [Pirellulaceae bacterium]
MELRVTPHGLVTCYAGDEEASWAAAIASRFSESESAGLVALAAATVPPSVHASVSFWRDIAAEFVRALCHVPETVPLTADAIEWPTAGVLAEWAGNTPPMVGAEYVSPQMLHDVWQRLLDWSMAQAEQCGGLNAFLQAYAARWSRVGRVTLHLAENKGDAEYPFAFMATYASGLSRSGRVQRLPLGRALQQYAGARKKPELLKLLSPLHAAAKRSELIADLVETGDVFHPLVWTPSEAYQFLREIPTYEECGLLAQLPNWWQKRTRPRVTVTLDGKNKKSAIGQESLLAFDISVALGDQKLSAAEAEALLEGNEGLVLFKGQWVEVDKQKLREALDHWQRVEKEVGSDGVSFIDGMRMLAGAPHDLTARDEAVAQRDAWSTVQAGDGLRKTLSALRAPEELRGGAPSGFHGQLRHYQLHGLNWLWFCSRLQVGCCLADDMGLGKTIQILALLLRDKQRKQKEGPRPSLLIVPASLLGNWKSEATRFAPKLNLLVAHSSETSRKDLDEIAAGPRERLGDTDLVITTYSMTSRLGWLSQVDWAWIILDEAQAIKNASTRQTRAVKKLTGDARVALTGTPVENRLGDLWSIFDFLNPGLLGSAKRFKSFVKTLEGGEHPNYAPLRKLVAPYILRRLKTDPDIVPDLPEKTEMQVFCGLSKPQAVLYKQSVAALSKSLAQTGDEG